MIFIATLLVLLCAGPWWFVVFALVSIICHVLDADERKKHWSNR